MKILIKGGHVVDPANNIDDVMDIYVADGIIQDVGKDIASELEGLDIEVIDAEGMMVVPGLVDMHVHLRDPGLEYKEDIETGTKAAVMGGVTSVACMPNTKPVTDNKAIVSYIKNKAKEVGYANVYPIGAVTKGLEGKELAEIGDMKFEGAVAVSDDGRPVSDSALMRKAIQYASMFDMKVISHCEDMSLAEGGLMNDGATASRLGLKGIPNAAEDIQIARDIILAESLDLPVHIAHVSTKGGVELVRQAKARGVKVTAETCPHYFSLTDEACDGFNTLAKMNPPLRTPEDVEAVKDGLKDGTLDAIVTDHAPHHKDEKDCEFGYALNGIVGLETSLGIALKYLVNEGVLTMSQLVEKMSYNPSKILGIAKGTLGEGKIADITIFNPDEKWTVDITKLNSKSKNSPYHGYELCGKPKYVIVGGKIIVNQGVIA